MEWKTNGPRTVPQAFPYQGSKRQLVGQILSLIPTDLTELIEPFAGSAAVTVAARYYGLCDKVTISDVNGPLMDLWSLIIEDPHGLIGKYEDLWYAQLDDPKSFFLRTREAFNQSKEPDLLFYLLARCVKAAVRYGKNGDFNQSADNRRLGAKPAVMADRVLAASKLMQGATVETGSYEEKLLSASTDAVVYMDPPYQGTSHVPDHRYLLGLRRGEFSSVLSAAVEADISFIVSYDVVTEDNKYGEALPAELGLIHRHVAAGVSSQATLTGRSELTVESLYISPALVARLGGATQIDDRLQDDPRSQDLLV